MMRRWNFSRKKEPSCCQLLHYCCQWNALLGRWHTSQREGLGHWNVTGVWIRHSQGTGWREAGAGKRCQSEMFTKDDNTPFQASAWVSSGGSREICRAAWNSDLRIQGQTRVDGCTFLRVSKINQWNTRNKVKGCVEGSLGACYFSRTIVLSSSQGSTSRREMPVFQT